MTGPAASGNPDPTYDQVKEIKEKYQKQLLARANVVGLGIGYRIRRGESTGEHSLIVMVERKLPPEALEEQDLLPREIEGIPVDVQEVGRFTAL
jgi:hypothetical protein